MPNPGKALSFFDIIERTGAGIRHIATRPEHQKFDTFFGQAQKNLSPEEVRRLYEAHKNFATPQGERLKHRTDLGNVAQMDSGEARRITQGKLPRSSAWNQSLVTPNQVEVSSFHVDPKPPGYFDEPLYAAQMTRADRMAQNRPWAYETPTGYGIEALDYTANQSGNPRVGGMGALQYASLLDQIRAGGGYTASTSLTDVNVLRKLANMMSYGLRHGDYEHAAPVISGDVLPDESSQLFGRGSTGGAAAKQALAQILRSSEGEPVFDAARDTIPSDLIPMTTDEITGLLGLREAALVRAAGPVPEPGMLEPGDIGLLKSLTLPALRSSGKYDMRSGIGPHTLGRAATVEQIIEKVLRGASGGEAAQDIMDQSRRRLVDGLEGYKGRYAKGGLARAAIDS